IRTHTKRRSRFFPAAGEPADADGPDRAGPLHLLDATVILGKELPAGQPAPPFSSRTRSAMPCQPWRLFLLFLIRVASAGLQAAEPGERPFTDADRAHWAFQKPAVVLPPAVHDAGWVRTPVDAFILARLARLGLHPAPPAERASLLRRATFDVTGLP